MLFKFDRPIEELKKSVIEIYTDWINSMNIANVRVNDLIEDAKDGVIISKIIHHKDNNAIDLNDIRINPQ